MAFIRPASLAVKGKKEGGGGSVLSLHSSTFETQPTFSPLSVSLSPCFCLPSLEGQNYQLYSTRAWDMASEEQSREEGLENFLSRRRRGNDTTANTNNDSIIPPLALSLKSRECSAMAFKHIFDQIRLHKSLSSSSSSCSPNLEHVGLAPSHVGLVENSPISHHSSLPTQGGRARQEVGTAPPPPLASLATLRSQSNTAPQLTIFYSGTVCVYDGISADKAHAIMVLAGSGQSTANPACFEAISSPLSLGLMASELPHARKASLARFLGKRKDICGPALTDVSDLKE